MGDLALGDTRLVGCYLIGVAENDPPLLSAQRPRLALCVSVDVHPQANDLLGSVYGIEALGTQNI